MERLTAVAGQQCTAAARSAQRSQCVYVVCVCMCVSVCVCVCVNKGSRLSTDTSSTVVQGSYSAADPTPCALLSPASRRSPRHTLRAHRQCPQRAAPLGEQGAAGRNKGALVAASPDGLGLPLWRALCFASLPFPFRADAPPPRPRRRKPAVHPGMPQQPQGAGCSRRAEEEGGERKRGAFVAFAIDPFSGSVP